MRSIENPAQADFRTPKSGLRLVEVHQAAICGIQTQGVVRLRNGATLSACSNADVISIQAKSLGL